jgi:hypothetical protein
MEYGKIINTILVLDRNKIEEGDRKVLQGVKNRINIIMTGGVVLAICGSVGYSALARRYISKYRLGFDIFYILGFTSLVSGLHVRMIERLDLDEIRRRYRYMLSNSVVIEKDRIFNTSNVLNYIHSLNIKHFYLTILLVLRILV